MLMGDLNEKENKNKITTENDILYCTKKKCYHWGSNLILNGHFFQYMSVTSTYCAMYSFAFINKHE